MTNPVTPPPAQTQPVEAQDEPVAWQDKNTHWSFHSAEDHHRYEKVSSLYRPLYAAPQPAVAVGEVERLAWQTMETAPKDGSQFIAFERWDGDRAYARVYEWVGPPNYWHSKREGVCIRPEYQDRFMWVAMPDTAPPAALHGSEKGEA